MSIKAKKSNATVKSGPSENTLNKKATTKILKGVNEGEFSSNFRKFCIECNTAVIPNVRIISADDLSETTTASCSKISLGSSGIKEQQSDNKKALVYVPEVLVIPDETTATAVEVIFRQFRVDGNMLIALTKTLKMTLPTSNLYAHRLEFCHLSSQDIKALSVILRMINTISEVSVDGNPNKLQNFDLLLKETKLLTLSLRFCGINKYGIKNIMKRIDSFTPDVTLLRLNLSSNFLGDEGVACIAETLRVNRSLLILNLADNQITDKGCEKIAEVLQSFALNENEVKFRRMRILDVLKQKQLNLNATSVSRITTGTNTRKRSDSLRKREHEIIKKDKSGLKGTSPTTTPRTSISIKSKSDTSRSEIERTSNTINERFVAEDLHPFIRDTNKMNREWYCIGNNKLINLNLAYNKITQVGLRFLIQMLTYQTNSFILPDIGILRISLEGNYTPNCCSEMKEILDLIRHKNDCVNSSLSSRNRLSVTSTQ